MDPMKDLETFWNWLPAFRAVAESGSLGEAAVRLGTSASALSRTIRLLETSLGRDLFTRTGRNMELNPDGRAFLNGVRDGMRAIHESTVQLTRPEPHGALRISCTGLYHTHIPALLEEICTRFPELRPELRFYPTNQLNAALLRGDLDVAICADPHEDEHVTIELLDTVHHAVYCGAGHPLHDVADPSLEEILAHPFVGPPPSIPRADHWPPQLRRDVALRVHQVVLAVEVCASGRLLAFLPSHAALERQPLRRIDLPENVETRLYALRRTDVNERQQARLVIEAFRERIAREPL